MHNVRVVSREKVDYMQLPKCQTVLFSHFLSENISDSLFFVLCDWKLNIFVLCIAALSLAECHFGFLNIVMDILYIQTMNQFVDN